MKGKTVHCPFLSTCYIRQLHKTQQTSFKCIAESTRKENPQEPKNKNSANFTSKLMS